MSAGSSCEGSLVKHRLECLLKLWGETRHSPHTVIYWGYVELSGMATLWSTFALFN